MMMLTQKHPRKSQTTIPSQGRSGVYNLCSLKPANLETSRTSYATLAEHLGGQQQFESLLDASIYDLYTNFTCHSAGQGIQPFRRS